MTLVAFRSNFVNKGSLSQQVHFKMTICLKFILGIDAINIFTCSQLLI